MKLNKYKFSILFVEDEMEVRENYVLYLENIFENVYQAKDGQEAYKIYKELKPDIMIIDINIPKLNGIELLKMIRKTDHTTKAIMLTAHADTKYLLEASELKLTKYLVKPVSRAKLHEALGIAVEELYNFKVSSVAKQLSLSENYIWDLDLDILYHHDQTVTLTAKERKLATILFSDTDKIFSYDDLIYRLWDYDENGNADSIKTLIKNLRRKLPKNIIKNIFGIGYKIEINN